MTTVGEKVWNRLRAEGGFVHTMADGRQFVRFNRGYHCSPELREVLKRHREDLKEFVNQRHAELDRLGWSADGVGTPGGSRRPAPNGRDKRSCDCNAAARLPISGKSADSRPGCHRPVKAAAVSAVATLLALNFAATSEISGAKDLAVDFEMCAFYESSSGGGARVCLTPGANQTKGVEK